MKELYYTTLEFLISIDWAFLKELQWEAIVGAISLIYIIRKDSAIRKKDSEERKKLRQQEEKEMYKSYKTELKEQLRKITGKYQRQLQMSYQDFKGLKEVLGSEEAARINRAEVFNLFDLMSDIEFMYCKHMKDGSVYWKRFDHIFKYIFDKPYFKTAFVRFQKTHSVNTSFIEYVEGIIYQNHSNKEKEVVEGEVDIALS